MMTFRMILLAGLTLILMGCQTMPAKPLKPKLESLKRMPDGGMCLDRQDTLDLGRYIQELRGFL